MLIDLGSLTPSPLPIPSRSSALAHQDHAATHTTASYRPPELWQVKAGVELDGRVDVWGLGCVLYWVATGRSAMERDGGVSMLQCVEGRLEWEEGDRQRYSAAFREYVQGMVQAKYEQRWQLDEVMERGWRLLDMGQAGRLAALVDATEGWASFDGEEDAQTQEKGREKKRASVKKKDKEKENGKERERVVPLSSADVSRHAPIPSLNTAALAAALAGDDAEDDAVDGGGLKKKKVKGKKGRRKKKEEKAAVEDGEEDDDSFADFQSASFSSAQPAVATVQSPSLSVDEEGEEDEFSDFTGSGATSPAG